MILISFACDPSESNQLNPWKLRILKAMDVAILLFHLGTFSLTSGNKERVVSSVLWLKLHRVFLVTTSFTPNQLLLLSGLCGFKEKIAHGSVRVNLCLSLLCGPWSTSEMILNAVNLQIIQITTAWWSFEEIESFPTKGMLVMINNNKKKLIKTLTTNLQQTET